MPTTTTDQGLSLPVDADTADNPVAFANFVAGVEPRLVRLYTNEADRTAKQLVVAENELSGLGTENRVEVYNGATNISLHTRAVHTTTRIAVDQVLTASSTVLQNITNMVATLPGTAGAIFAWRGHVFYDATTTADIKFAFTIPAAATMRWGMTALGPGGTNPIYTSITGSGTAISIGALGIGSVLYAVFSGEVTMGATPGNLQLQGAQNTSDPSVTTVFARSFMEVWRTA
ncbi:MAG TPA: hypothetical protein VK899_11940 [Gemmatimonadales bacterium]|nr:hypothetical protein [Gemmatimonadales bacterium]